MDALIEALQHPGAFPAGLFWLHRGEAPPLPCVAQLLARAAEATVDAALVMVENFDEALRDLIRLVRGIDTTVLDAFAVERRRWSSVPRPEGNRGWPVVRFNALPVVQTPSVCRRVACRVGGYAEARDAIKQAGVDVLVARTNAGVLAFGADADVRIAFEPYGITDFDLHTIETKHLHYESGERGLLRDALTRAIARHRRLDAIRRRNADLLAPSAPRDGFWAPLLRLVGPLSGTVSDHPELRWREGIAIRLDWADDRLWLLVEPRTVFDGITFNNKAVAADFARERTVKRYNRQLNDLIAYWSALLFGDGEDLHALGIGEGVDAAFRFASDTSFSRRAQV
jgi:hypothetical protein